MYIFNEVNGKRQKIELTGKEIKAAAQNYYNYTIDCECYGASLAICLHYSIERNGKEIYISMNKCRRIYKRLQEILRHYESDYLNSDTILINDIHNKDEVEEKISQLKRNRR